MNRSRLLLAAVVALVVVAAPSGNAESREGIKIHGHWTIEVRNPDGTVAQRREFENALTDTGAMSLALFLGRKNLVGNWEIDLDASSGVRPCKIDVDDRCRISEKFTLAIVVPDRNQFMNLQPSIVPGSPVDHPDAGALALTGVATAANNSAINQVATTVWVCNVSPNPITTVPPPCLSLYEKVFSSARLSSPVNVIAGQFIQVTVVFSFS